MKRIFCIMILIITFILTGCSKADDTPSVKGAFSVNKEIYSDNKIELSCKEINPEAIVFECKNKTSKEIEFFFDIALDGVLQDIWIDSDECTVPSGKTKKFNYYFDKENKNTEHSTISIAGSGFADDTEYMSFEVVDAKLGGESNPDKIETGENIFASDVLDIGLIGLGEDGINFYVDNKTDKSMSIDFDDVILNQNEEGYGCCMTIPAKSKGAFEHDLTCFIEDFNSDDIKSFEGLLSAEILNKESIPICKVFYDNGKISSTILAIALASGSNSSSEKSITEKAYSRAVNLTRFDLTDGSNGKWRFKGFRLAPRDCEWINDSLNRRGTVEAGAIYRMVEYLLKGYDMGINTGENYCKMVFGIDFIGREATAPYVESAKAFYSERYPILSIMKKFDTAESITGTFDYANGDLGKYYITITDTTKGAEELMISEEMLGYIIASLTEYEASISFSGNSCSIVYEGW